LPNFKGSLTAQTDYRINFNSHFTVGCLKIHLADNKIKIIRYFIKERERALLTTHLVAKEQRKK
jgi:hypothetical protein